MVMRRARDGISKKRAKAFTLTEILISMIIVAILGGVAVAALWLFLGSFSQMDDYTSAESELNYAVQRLNSDFALIGLGMPNNRKGRGSFASAFRNMEGEWPVMALMGDVNASWGGPVTVAQAGAEPTPPYSSSSIPAVVDLTEIVDSVDWSDEKKEAFKVYVGPELYYACGIPTSMNARFSRLPPISEGGNLRTATNNTKLRISPVSPNSSYTGRDYLENFRYEGRLVGLDTVAIGQNTRTWLLFPTLKLPMLFESWVENELNVVVAPSDENVLRVQSTIMGLDEIHMVHAARLYRENDELVRVIFSGEDNVREVLAHSIVGLQFAYNPTSRILTMYVAARGHERDPVGGGQPSAWPSWLPELSDADARFRVVVKTLMWKIKN